MWRTVGMTTALAIATTLSWMPRAPAAPELVTTDEGGVNQAPGAPVTGSAAAAYFYDALAPYGEWMEVQPWGPVWRPSPAVVGDDFRPYVTGGHWVFTDVGWSFESSFGWGWAPFHYGRWAFLPGSGWIWVPGTVWGPAWVDWRFGDGCVGWSPLTPAGAFFFEPFWFFVPTPFFVSFDLHHHIFPHHHEAALLARSQPIHRVIVHDNVRFRAGPDVHVIEGPHGGTIVPIHRGPPVDALHPHAPGTGPVATPFRSGPFVAPPARAPGGPTPVPATPAPGSMPTRTAPVVRPEPRFNAGPALAPSMAPAAPVVSPQRVVVPPSASSAPPVAPMRAVPSSPPRSVTPMRAVPSSPPPSVAPMRVPSSPGGFGRSPGVAPHQAVHQPARMASPRR